MSWQCLTSLPFRVTIKTTTVYSQSLSRLYSLLMSPKQLSKCPPVFPDQSQPPLPSPGGWTRDSSSAGLAFTTFLSIGTNLFEFSGIEPDNKSEVHKRTRGAPAPEGPTHRPQTRQLKEAGASTHNDQVVIKSSVANEQAPSTCDQTNKFKQANETPAPKTLENEGTKEGRDVDMDADKTRESPKTTGLTKTRSYGQRSCTLRDRTMKNSTKDANRANGTKSAENEDDLLADEEIEDNNQSQSSPSFTGSTGDGAGGKRKSGSARNQKSSRK